jgi:hypothetical protein
MTVSAGHQISFFPSVLALTVRWIWCLKSSRVHRSVPRLPAAVKAKRETGSECSGDDTAQRDTVPLCNWKSKTRHGVQRKHRSNHQGKKLISSHSRELSSQCLDNWQGNFTAFMEPKHWRSVHKIQVLEPIQSQLILFHTLTYSKHQKNWNNNNFVTAIIPQSSDGCGLNSIPGKNMKPLLTKASNSALRNTEPTIQPVQGLYPRG